MPQCDSQFLRSLDDTIVYCVREPNHKSMHIGQGSQGETLQWTDAQAFKPDERLPFPHDELDDPTVDVLASYFPDQGTPVRVHVIGSSKPRHGNWDRTLIVDSHIEAVSFTANGPDSLRVIVPWPSIRQIIAG